MELTKGRLWEEQICSLFPGIPTFYIWTLLSKVHEAILGAGIRSNPTFSLFLWKSQCSMCFKIWLDLLPCPSKSDPGSAQQQKMASQHPPFSVIFSKLEFPWTTFRTLAIFTGAQTNRHCICNYCFLLDGVGWLWTTILHLPSRSSTTASQLTAQIVKTRTHVICQFPSLCCLYWEISRIIFSKCTEFLSTAIPSDHKFQALGAISELMNKPSY